VLQIIKSNAKQLKQLNQQIGSIKLSDKIQKAIE
jgi:hypothetical protein